MKTKEATDKIFNSLEDATLIDALNALGRSINIISTYGTEHPAFKQSIGSTLTSIQSLLAERKKVTLGSFNGNLTVDEMLVHANGTLIKSLERHLVRLRITGLRLDRGISEAELSKLAELLSTNEADEFDSVISQSGLSHIASETTRFQAVQEDQVVANKSDLTGGMGGDGILVIEDELSGGNGDGQAAGEPSVHVDQIVAFLQGDLDVDDENVSEELAEIASDPAKLGKMIMESVAIRQSASQLSGESMSDVILGCLRRTFSGLRKQPAFQTTEGVADLQKALLLLEEGMLDKIRAISGESDDELDRQIVQTIREMDDNLGFELAASRYMEYREAIEANEEMLKDYVRTNGTGAAADLISDKNFPSSDWKRIVIESQNPSHSADGNIPPVAAGLNTLTHILEKLEHLMTSDAVDSIEMNTLLGEANNNLGSSRSATKEKLDTLSDQLHVLDEDTGTIDGNAQEMDRKELLSSIAEIAQELMQPLTAINASLEMLLSGYAGEVSSDQHNLISLASCSGDDLKYLMNELIKIVGLPINRGVDKRFALPSKEHSGSSI
jgi:hypothetical protein